jgi:Flp pilus assembly pilin Flp
MWTALNAMGTRLRADRRAATAIEYALIASLVTGAAMTGMIALGISLDLLFTNVSSQVAAHTPLDPARCVEVGSSCPK